jgi:predicted alpha/beta hydrolase family esterase
MRRLAGIASVKSEVETNVIILPGFGGSDENHWQSRWQSSSSRYSRFAPGTWELPELSDWIDALHLAIGAQNAPPILVAHSLACLLVAHWQRVSKLPIVGAVLVAVPNPNSPVYTDVGRSFADPPTEQLPFPSLVVASDNDPFATIEYSRTLAIQWGSGFVEAGSLGHIGSASGVGDWKQGRDLVTAFMAGLGATGRS